MSSNDRHNRPGQHRPAPAPAEQPFQDDFLYEDDWEVDNDFDDPYQPQEPAPRRAAPQQPASRQTAPQPQRRSSSTPASLGTAAQIDRLRQNIRQQTRRPSVAPPGRSNVQRSSRQSGRHAPPHDDVIVDDDTYFDDRDYRQQPPPYRQSPASQTRTYRSPGDGAARSQLVYDSGAYDDVDEDGAYEDDFDAYDAPRRPARPAPQIRMPTISRPTLPPAIANADLVNDAPALGFIGVGLVSLAGMAILVANRVDSLSPQFSTHVSASGVLEHFREESALWNLPLMAAMFTLMGIVMAWFISPIDRFASRFVLAGALVTQFVCWVALFRIL